MSAMDANPALNASTATGARTLSDMPDDELRHYAGELGLDIPREVPRGELIRRIRDRQELLIQLDRDALLDVVIWARRPVRESASKEVLAREIAHIERGGYEQLSLRGLRALAALRGVPSTPADSIDSVASKLRTAEGVRKRLNRWRRKMVGAALSNLIEAEADSGGAYQFLPEDDASRRVSLKHEIQDRGIVGGLASRLRGAADDYLREKMDEIERRIDQKLDDIDRRMSEWRDREVANRLRIIKITLAASVLFAVVSVGYHWITRSSSGESSPPAATNQRSEAPAR